MAWALAAYLVTRSAFVLWWEPANIECWAPTIPFVVLLMALMTSGGAALSTAGRARAIAVAVLAAATLGLNLFGLIGPLRGTASSTRAQEVLSVGEGGIIVFLDYNEGASLRREGDRYRSTLVDGYLMFKELEKIGDADTAKKWLSVVTAAHQGNFKSIVFSRDTTIAPKTSAKIWLEVSSQAFNTPITHCVDGHPWYVVISSR